MSYLLELNDKIIEAKDRISEAKRIVSERTAELNELQKLVWFCPECKKYYPKESVTYSSNEVTSTELVYSDAGYGDDDVLAEVTRLVTYAHCPVCGNQFAQDRGTYLREKNRHTRT